MSIYITNKNDKDNWNDFVFKNAGSIFHLWEWGDVVEKSLGFKRRFIKSQDKDGKLNGILPLFLSGDSEDKLISPPYTGYIDALAKNQGVKRALYEFVLNHFIKRNVNFEFYTSEKQSQLAESLTQTSSGLCNFLLNTDCSYEDIFYKKLDTNKRKRLRKIAKMGIKIGQADRSDLNNFYRMHLKMMEKLGFSPLPKLLFKLAFNNFKKHSIFIKSIVGEETGAYLWSLFYGGKLYLWRSAYLRDLSKAGIYDVLIENAIKEACRNKDIKEVDMGISVCKSGAAFFKRKWGFSSREIYLIKNDKDKNKNLLGDLRYFILGRAD